MENAAASAGLAVVGAGALGCAVLQELTSLPGIALTIIDGDRVEAGNPGRQPLYDVADIGRPKVEAAISRLMAKGASGLRPVDAFLHDGNARQLLRGHRFVLDCTDDLHAKRVIDEACRDLRVPLISGGVHAAQGQVVWLHGPGPGEGLMRSDLFAGRITEEQDGCDMRGVPAEVISAVAVRMSGMAEAFLRGIDPRNAELAVFDQRTGHWSTFCIAMPA
ncbi:MAG: ThiF family adenylyltransferase [Flavobacteriales bacterium]|nr:MAG: ThiF family adenylyltransferase [Flavobacteriales bacterium]